MYMNTDAFDCCGLGELVGFSEYPMSKEALVRLKETLKREYDIGDRVNMSQSHIIVTLKDNQRQSAPVLRSLGFKLVGSAVNPNTDNRLWMYVYMRPEKKAAPKRKPKLTFKK